MYLITVEGGDGSGKGLATQMIAEILQPVSYTHLTLPTICSV